jgi:hypothetical protein
VSAAAELSFFAPEPAPDFVYALRRFTFGF